jgi:hypothetical protein
MKTPRMTDRYDDAIAHLTENPRDITDAWTAPSSAVGGCLFAFVRPKHGEYHFKRPDGRRCGCLTQIRDATQRRVSWWPSITNAIRFDKRLPKEVLNITIESLTAFADWQRIIDTLEEADE